MSTTRLQSLLAALSPAALSSTAAGALRARLAPDDAERGDVPGWVLITVMTAALVTLLWAAAASVLPNLFSQAVSSVSGGGGG